MPQLRHAATSALVAEADDPIALVVVADAVGINRVVFDDVGPGFNVTVAIDTAADRARADDAQAAWDKRLRGEIAAEVDMALEAVGPEMPDPTPIQIEP